MRIAVRTYHPHDGLDSFGGGEQRWSANLSHFLRTEGHEVIRCHEGQDSGCDIFFDASWERCQFSKARTHIHFSFSGSNKGALEFPCIQNGTCNYANPYRQTHEEGIKWSLEEPNINPVFVPQPYPDDLFAAAFQTHGFQRNNIFWGTKDMFHPSFCKPEHLRPGGREHVFVQNGLDTMRALLRFQKKVDFHIHFALRHHLNQAPPRLGVQEMLRQFRNAAYSEVMPWQQLVGYLSTCKFNVPVGGLWGSAPESMAARSLPLLYPRNQFYSDMNILPNVNDATEDEIYDALERLWFDENAYNEIYDVLQEKIKDHRTGGLRKNLKLVFEKVGAI